MIEGLFKAMDLQILKGELERQGKLVDELKAKVQQLKKDGDDKESRIHFLTAELERLGKLIGEPNNQLNNQTLRSEQERQGKLLEELVQESNKHSSWFNPHNCSEAKLSGTFEAHLAKFSSQPFKVACDANTKGGGWTILLRRMDGSVNFYRTWTEYKEGFGDLNGEFFLGLDKIHALTADTNQELLVVLEDRQGNETYELYESFAIGDEDQQYVLHTLGEASGTAGDSLSAHLDMKFSTFDRDNDTWEKDNCAVLTTGAWWYSKCHFSNLAGTYNDDSNQKGVNWFHFKGHDYSLKRAVMMIRPKK
ncbi:microfibril-associated glycoprotein 4-like [Drosophila innubila]|uniref:microfibril-associated glycoprotein 4-like n=1 Tax=Drosophila innubila TaxID=198719 RepID=UPI00148C09E6|nr:microfibril-associated glycoprotein 4-like [Drosophila innubila]